MVKFFQTCFQPCALCQRAMQPGESVVPVLHVCVMGGPQSGKTCSSADPFGWGLTGLRAVSLQRWTDRCQGLINSWVNNILPSVAWNASLAFQLTSSGPVWQLQALSLLQLWGRSSWHVDVPHIERSDVGSFEGIAFRISTHQPIFVPTCIMHSVARFMSKRVSRLLVAFLAREASYPKTGQDFFAVDGSVTWKTELQDVLTLKCSYSEPVSRISKDQLLQIHSSTQPSSWWPRDIN